MKQLPHFSSLFYNQPWNILPAQHAELGNLYQNYIHGRLAPMETSPPRESERAPGLTYLSSGISYQMDAASGIVIVSAQGVIVKRVPEMLCGPSLVDLAKLDGLLSELAASGVLRTLVLDLDSPGGSVTGLLETAALIREVAASGVRVVSYADGLCASAGYYLAVAALLSRARGYSTRAIHSCASSGCVPRSRACGFPAKNSTRGKIAPWCLAS